MRAAHGFTDGLRIVGVVLPTAAVGRDKLRRHQARVMTEFAQFSRPVVRAGAGFDADQARRQLGEKCQHLPARQALPEYDLALSIDAMNLEHGFGDVEPDAHNILHDPFSSVCGSPIAALP